MGGEWYNEKMEFIKNFHFKGLFAVSVFLIVLCIGIFLFARTERNLDKQIEPLILSTAISPSPDLPLREFDPTREIMSISSTPRVEGEVSQTVAEIKSAKSVKENLAIYETILKKEGWNARVEHQDARMVLLMGVKNISGITVLITEAEDGSRVQITTSNQ